MSSSVGRVRLARPSTISFTRSPPEVVGRRVVPLSVLSLALDAVRIAAALKGEKGKDLTARRGPPSEVFLPPDKEGNRTGGRGMEAEAEATGPMVTPFFSAIGVEVRVDMPWLSDSVPVLMDTGVATETAVFKLLLNRRAYDTRVTTSVKDDNFVFSLGNGNFSELKYLYTASASTPNASFSCVEHRSWSSNVDETGSGGMEGRRGRKTGIGLVRGAVRCERGLVVPQKECPLVPISPN